MNILSLNNSQVITLAANAATSSTAIQALNFRIVSQVGIHIAVGASPTATTSTAYIPAGVITQPISIGMGERVNVLNATSTAAAKVTLFY